MLDTTLLVDYAWADLKKAAKMAMINVALGGKEMSRITGGAITRLTAEEAEQLYLFACRMESLESGDGDTALVQFRES